MVRWLVHGKSLVAHVFGGTGELSMCGTMRHDKKSTFRLEPEPKCQRCCDIIYAPPDRRANYQKSISLRGDLYGKYRSKVKSNGKTMAGVLEKLINEKLDAIEMEEKIRGKLTRQSA